jgi:hypothetical protein
VRALAAMAAAFVFASCHFDVPNQNFNTISDLTGSNPSRSSVATATQGLLGSVAGTNAGLRNFFTTGFNPQTTGILGREVYNLDVSNPQNIPTFYQPTQGNSFKNLQVWNAPYATIYQANVVLGAIDNVIQTTAAEKEGVKGVAQTVKAISLFFVIRGTDVNGAVLDQQKNATDDPGPIVGKPQVFARIFSLLDSAQTHLKAAGDTFMFAPPPGFLGFGGPAAFLQFNRGIRGWADVDIGDYAGALTDLAQSFLDTTKVMAFGVYGTFSTAGTDVTNNLFDPTSRQRYLHPAVAADAQLQAGAAPGDTTRRDLRFLSKAKAISPVTRYGFTVNWGANVYNSTNSPWAILKNEQLILLRAEARLACNGVAPAVACGNIDRAGALADVNTVRVKSGGLAPVLAPTPTPPRNGVNRTSGDPLLDEVLYNKRYSMLMENGDRWVDARHYGLLPALKSDERPGDVVWPYLMIPIAECLPRNPQPAACTTFPPAI